MATLERLDAAAVRSTIEAFRDALAAHAALLNRLNVYPVPDGDTGTNMARTLDAVVAELAAAGPDMAATCHAISHGSLMGARGNSGVILSQVLRGLVAGFETAPEVGPAELAAGLRNGAAAAYRAVLRPVEGTILTVVREAANAAERAADVGGTLFGVLEAAREAGQVALNRTPELLPVLRDAGVVDAGGAGFLLLLDALLHVVADRPLPVPEEVPAGGGVPPLPVERVAARGTRGHGELAYEVMFLLDLPDAEIEAFRAAWGAIGDSIVVVGGDGEWTCHIHTDQPGPAIESALDLGGRPRRIQITDLRDEVDDVHAARDARLQRPDEPAGLLTTAVVAVGEGPGVTELLTERGAARVVTGGQSMNPSTAELLAAADGVPADDVVLLPNNPNVIAVAEQAAELCEKHVHTVPTVSVAQGLLVLGAYDGSLDGATNAAAMAAAAERVRSGCVTHAVREATCEAGAVRPGQWVGLVDGRGITVVADELGEALLALAGEVLSGSGASPAQRLLVLAGEGAQLPVTRTLRAWLDEHHAGLQVEVHDGGQPVYPYLLAAT